jgi:hypothetical protein
MAEAWGAKHHGFGVVCSFMLSCLQAILIQGGAGGGMTGLVNNLRQIVWIPVAQVGCPPSSVGCVGGGGCLRTSSYRSGTG